MIEQWLNTIQFGNAFELIKEIPDKSISSICTSPPYWAQRNYGTGHVVFGGDPNCQHKWFTKIGQVSGGHGNRIQNSNKGSHFPFANSNCEICGAYKGELGLEPTFELYLEHLLSLFDDVWRILKDDGTLFVNLDDTYSTVSGNMNSRAVHQPLWDTIDLDNVNIESTKNRKQSIRYKSLCLIPQRFAIAMCDRGWILRNDLVWHKMNALPESVNDRFTSSHEHVFFFTKSERYYFKTQLQPCTYKQKRTHKTMKVHELDGTTRQHRGALDSGNGMKRMRSVLKVNTEPNSDGGHCAKFPTKLIDILVKAGCPEDGVVLDPFIGTGTTGLVALRNHMNFIGFEINPDYMKRNKKIREIEILTSFPKEYVKW